MIKLFDLLQMQEPRLKPSLVKVHLAVWNGEDDPFSVYLSGKFDEWQKEQTQKNFEREYIVSLIQLEGSNRWMFAGAYKSYGCKPIQGSNNYLYEIEVMQSLEDLSGRLSVSFKRSGRASYLVAENWIDSMLVEGLLPEKVVVNNFRGYKQSLISKNTLDIIVKQKIESWYSALSNVSGIYLITDAKTGDLYVGSATGGEGIWQRWCDYSKNGHGDNKELRALLKKNGKNYSVNFQYSILEIGDTHASAHDIRERESYWKKVLCSKDHGNNDN